MSSMPSPRGVCRECGQVYRGYALLHSPSPCEKCGGQVVIVGKLDTTEPPSNNKEYRNEKANGQ
jgi:rRNA maturation endonuclease Nob1